VFPFQEQTLLASIVIGLNRVGGVAKQTGLLVGRLTRGGGNNQFTLQSKAIYKMSMHVKYNIVFLWSKTLTRMKKPRFQVKTGIAGCAVHMLSVTKYGLNGNEPADCLPSFNFELNH
jgi:hypothetical protein